MLLENILCGKDIRDGDCVTQGLGSLWSLILGRPHQRQAFLDIALKCVVHPKDFIRAKAIRLRPRLLQLVFDKYDHAPKAVKQAIHRHVPILIRALGLSYSDLLSIISYPPHGSENLQGMRTKDDWINMK
uniref:Symplekin C-terminal domain-containing protein n=1 Tax=Lactuca sativa TaxID=4236 RepID=A0A9R1WDT1_LACSA|nr:hypothetical protein LSAT_V11C200081170 [Lactuca sativa]